MFYQKELKEQKEELKKIATMLWSVESQTKKDANNDLRIKLGKAWVLIDEIYTTLFGEEY